MYEKLKIKKIHPDAHIPTKAHETDAGMDLYALGGYYFEPNETIKVSTGIAIQLPHNTFGGIYARSGLATKQGLRPANCTGVIDECYTGEIIVALHNDSGLPQYIKTGDRVAQLVVQPYISTDIIEVDELEQTDRGEGGFGSSGN